ncbi:unnamed protein product [Pleuronectes platessa]|uniref:Uncharacterized protein n=1 Tax=Pleuronectes platessa TaxID=8262 RepID=A0A9N7VYK5_PLEPL|nr:unnamed protein product [Pleuronectes platessa]
MEVPRGGPPPPIFPYFPSISTSSVHPLHPCSLNSCLNYPTTGCQCSKMGLIIIISAPEVDLETAALSTATRQHVSMLVCGATGPLRPNCIRQLHPLASGGVLQFPQHPNFHCHKLSSPPPLRTPLVRREAIRNCYARSVFPLWSIWSLRVSCRGREKAGRRGGGQGLEKVHAGKRRAQGNEGYDWEMGSSSPPPAASPGRATVCTSEPPGRSSSPQGILLLLVRFERHKEHLSAESKGDTIRVVRAN